MKQEKEAGEISAEIPNTNGNDQAEATSPYKTSQGITINFHSAEFNWVDELNDCSGNYRTFQSLDGVITADMRHQLERLRGSDFDHRADTDVGAQKNKQERSEIAIGTVAPSLTVVSQGRTLIVAADADRVIACGKLLRGRGLACTLLVVNKSGSDISSSQLDHVKLLEGGGLSITGAFGDFSVTVTTKENQQTLSAWCGDEASVFDLVLDLQATPSFAGDLLPMGYYAPGANLLTLQEMMAELPEMRGRFQRPQFTVFMEDRCFHGRSQARECLRCLAVCPFGAIKSVARKITIDHCHCQGCGGCALVCPADAIRLNHPSREELRISLRRMLEGRRGDIAALPPTLVISDLTTDQQLAGRGTGKQDQVYFVVDQIGYVGLEMLLTALVCGAGVVIVACGEQNPLNIRKAAEWQVQMGRAILRGLGMSEDTIQFALIATENVSFTTAGPTTQFNQSQLLSAKFSFLHDKRTLIRLVSQHLYDQLGVQQPAIHLPSGSLFGAVAVDSDACTLCMACAVICPAGALSAPGDIPRLEFVESRCHQCRLCEEACPEGAISLLPRILCDPEAVETPAVLNEAEPVRCIQCGVPFASQAMINRIRGKLTGHWMYSDDRQLSRLQMCRTCRTRDALVSQDVKSWNQ